MSFLQTIILCVLVLLFTQSISGTKTIPPRPSYACGVSQSCTKWPIGCKEKDCKILHKFRYNSNTKLYEIQIDAKIDGWVAFGLNDKQRIMGGSVGEICLLYKADGVPLVLLKGFENEGTDFHMKDLPSDVKVLDNMYTDGWLACSYTRPAQAGYLKDLNKPWFLISSWGEMRKHKDSEKPKEHSTGDYYWSKNRIDMKKNDNVVVTTFGWDLIAVHGCLMVLAWIGFASSGIFYARYTKEVWPNLSCRGNTFWFQLHRSLMFGSTLLVLCAFLVIVAEVKGWNQELGAHPVIGIIVIILVCIQAVAGIARPSIGSSWRMIFNWSHRASGVLAFILASIAIFLGLDAVGVDIVVLIFYLVVMLIIIVGVEARRIYKLRTVTEVQYREEELDGAEMETEEPNVFSAKEIFIRKAVALFVACVGFGMAVVMIIMIGHKAYVYQSNARIS